MLGRRIEPPLTLQGRPISSSSQSQLTAGDAANDERAARFFQKGGPAPDASALSDLIRAMDLTSLEGTEDEARARALCQRALRPAPEAPWLPSVAAVCVYPALIPECKRALEGSEVRVASVAGAFPSGRAALADKLREVRDAVDLGADEIDFVIDHQAILAGEDERVAEEIAQVKLAIGVIRLKVILETGQLRSHANVRRASELALGGGADFLKTSTGKTQPGATPGATLVMLEAITSHRALSGRKVGIKPAGGIRTARQAFGYAQMVEATLGKDWLVPERFRLGASTLLDDVVSELLAHRE